MSSSGLINKNIEIMTEFKKYLEQARQEFAYEVSKYNVESNLALRTASDSLLIAFDQATAKAIDYTPCCTEFICHSCSDKKSGQNDDQLHEVCKECFGSI